MRLDRRAVLRIGGVSLAGLVAGCADQGGNTTTEADGASADTTEPTGAGGVQTETTQTTEPAELPTETDAPTTQNATESPAETTTGTNATETTQTATPEPDGQLVDIDSMAFAPMEVSIDPGTEVRWVNRDGIPHEVTSARFNSGATQWDFSEEAEGDEEINYTFDDPGTYEYYCSIHGKSTMCGVVLVGDASRAGSLPCE